MNADRALLRLLQLASPALPVGAYSYSEGLEQACEAGMVHCADSLRIWLLDGLRSGNAQLEAGIALRVWHAWLGRDFTQLRYWDAWCEATRESEELRCQSLDMGRALTRLLRDLHPADAKFQAACAIPRHFCSIFGLTGAYWGIPQQMLFEGYLYAWAGNLVSAGVKLIPLGQTAGQQLVWSMQDEIRSVAMQVLNTSDDALESFSPGLALASMQHETQYTRLFRS